MNPSIIYSHTSLRGIAALTVLVTHITCEEKVSLGSNSWLLSIFKWPNQAVDLFFILSGFILNWVYCSKLASGIPWGSYITARCSRILPLYYLTLLTFLPPYFATFRIIGWTYENGKALKVFIANLLMISGFTGANHIDWVLNVPSWSISIEFFAYLFIFPVMVAFQRKCSYKIGFVVFYGCLLGLLCCYIFENKYLMGWDWTRFFRGTFGFTLGFMICNLIRHSKSPSDSFIDISLFASVLLVLFSVYKLIPMYTITVVSPFVVYLCAFDKGIFCNFIKCYPFEWLGERSFSIYLWHCPIIYIFFIPNIIFIDSHLRFTGNYLGWAHIVILLLVVGIVSEISYSYFEQPIRKYARRF
jgi:peptidoglycan/LPS O-acetylase OafA/YrhL